MTDPPCASTELHHPDEPSGYLERYEFAERMQKTHTQKRCPGCGSWRLWILDAGLESHD